MARRAISSDNLLIQKLGRGETVFCLPIRVSRLPHVVQMACAAGMDSIYFDMEHSSISEEDISRMSLLAWNTGVMPLVRVPSHDSHFILRTLEAGAVGVIVPHVNTADQALAAVATARFPPAGRRAMAGASAPLGYPRCPADEAAQRLEARTVVIVMLESTEAIAHADDIAAVPGVDVLLVGTGDLSDELGIHGKSDDPRIRKAYETVGAACQRHGCWLGVAGIKGNAPVLADLFKLGARFFTTRTDETLLLASMNEEVRILHQILKDR